MSWQESVDRVLAMRARAKLEAEKAELIKILQEVEERCQVVVNRQASAVLKDVPSWKQKPPGQKPATFRGGMRTWRDHRPKLEKRHRVEADRRERRGREFEQVLTGTLPLPEAVAQEEKDDGKS